MGNVEAKELICMTHGHELRRRGLLGVMGVPGGGAQRGKTGTTNNIIKYTLF